MSEQTTALDEWLADTANDPGSDEAIAAAKAVAGKPNADRLLRVAAELYMNEPACLASLRLSELDYLSLAISADEQGNLREQDRSVAVARDTLRAASDLRDRILGHAGDQQQAARALLERAGDNDSLLVPPSGHLDEHTIGEIESWASNTSGEEMFEAMDGLWLIYDNVG